MSKKRANITEMVRNNSEDTDNSCSSKKRKIEMTMEEYDKYLIEKKDGRFKRTGNWNGMYRRLAHECCDIECGQERLKWTANVPNTFYIFSLVDPGTKETGKIERALIKFGRTQHKDALKRYPTSELKQYQMKLLLTLRGKLITMTRIENWWKKQAEENKWFIRFSNSDFHGQTECIQVNDNDLAQLIAKSKEMAAIEE
ncbi:unnamed protein product [Adineta steineri]|uniref:Uncharacterized protein n=1 Tax=Adineta steineri TaxID=433720 RepID=A0A818SN54_9BILA|nr:unnamed protein product [Adineta steineri]CAF3671875.1 unnamed protein product [Adineta steineri]